MECLRSYKLLRPSFNLHRNNFQAKLNEDSSIRETYTQDTEFETDRDKTTDRIHSYHSFATSTRLQSNVDNNGKK